MHRTRVLLPVLLVCALCASLLSPRFVVPAAAQEAPAVGDAVPVSDDQGTTLGSITINEVIDPFTDVNPDFPPEDGSRYVVANVVFDADAGQRFDITPWTIVLQDDAGFLWNPIGLILPDDAQVPELTSQTLAPGSRISGLVGFVVPEGRTPARIFYQPQSSRVIPLAELLDVPPPNIGQSIAIIDSQGNSGAVTVTAFSDPFTAVDPTMSPPAGTRYVEVTLVYENTGDTRFFIEPYGLLLRDANGNLWNASSGVRQEEGKVVPDVTSAQLAPGDRLSGAAVFAVPDGVAATGVYDTPLSGQLLQLADLQGAASAEEQAATTDVATPTETEPATIDVSDPCLATETWLTATRERMAQAAEMSVSDAQTDDPDTLAEHADAFAALAEAQRTAAVPVGAEGANKALAATFNAYSSAVQQILDANEPGHDTAQELADAMNTFNAAGERMHAIEDQLALTAAACGLS